MAPLSRFETGKGGMYVVNMAKVQTVREQAGVTSCPTTATAQASGGEFTNGDQPGVRGGLHAGSYWIHSPLGPDQA
jgi:hypothetical protein